ncbi:MAG: hypothetical protein U9Q07_08180 [Planctomycetota bacterium]|nr:hypothetical protein [Planctomycetota bacterium]
MYSVLNSRVCTAHRNAIGGQCPPYLLGVSVLLILAGAGRNLVGAASLIRQIEQHSANKQRALALLSASPQLESIKRFEDNFRETWRRILIDGSYGNIEKTQFLNTALQGFGDSQQELPKALQSLLKSHRLLFGSGKNRNLMIRQADDAAFKPFGSHMSLSQAIAAISAGNNEPVQGFKTIFETGQNTRGYIHKLECHAGAVEFIYAVTDIVYGVMLPAELQFGPNRVVAEPAKVQMFYINAGDVIALHPYVLHSGSLSVEPDRSFSIIIYKKPAQTEDLVIRLPDAWQNWQGSLKLPDIDKYYLTLEELHTAELKNNKGFIAARRSVRLPAWP